MKPGKIIMSAGVSAGIDMALILVAEACGSQVAQAVQLTIEYAPDPPFNSGSKESAAADLVTAVTAGLAQRGASWIPSPRAATA